MARTEPGAQPVATAIATLAMVALIALMVAGLRQAGGLPLLTEDATWLLFSTG